MEGMKASELKAPSGAFFYVASPYTKYPGGIDIAHVDICRITAELIKRGVPVYSPIVHTHPIARFGDIDPLSHEIWLAADAPLMDSAFALIVVKMTGWGVSYGVSEEMKRFAAAGKPIWFLDPETMLVSEEP
jgi:hypothetical protein